MVAEIIAITLLGLGLLITLTGFIGFAVLIYGLMQLYKDDYK